jgi:GT2 family glycosyltransferase
MIKKSLKIILERISCIYKTRLIKEKSEYEHWASDLYKRSKIDLDRIKKEHRSFLSHGPLISLIIPAFEYPEKTLDKSLSCLKSQIYSRWELIVLNQSPESSYLENAINKLEYKNDKRVRYISIPRDINQLGEAINIGASKAKGGYICVLPMNTLLSNDALFWAAFEIYSKNPDLIYADEDVIGLDGAKYNHHFKPDLNLELLRSYNYFGNFVLYKAELIKKIGGFDDNLNLSTLYDMNLRIVLESAEDNISHISKILSHYRENFDQNLVDHDVNKLEVKSILEKNLKAANQKGAIIEIENLPGHFKIFYEIPKDPPKVSIIIPMRDKFFLTRECINSLVSLTNYKNYEIIIVDNGSQEIESIEYLHKVVELNKNIRVIKADIEFNFSKINNIGAKAAKGTLLCFLNNDIEIISSDWLREMVSLAIQPNSGCIGAKLIYPSGLIQHGGIVLGIGGFAGHAHKYLPEESPGYHNRLKLTQSISAVTGAALMIKKDIFEQIKGFNENYAVAFNDVDLCLRVRNIGLQNIWTPFATMIHHESLSRGSDGDPKNQIRFMKEINLFKHDWGEQLQNDPFYNVNLTLKLEDFSLKKLTE